MIKNTFLACFPQDTKKNQKFLEKKFDPNGKVLDPKLAFHEFQLVLSRIGDHIVGKKGDDNKKLDDGLRKFFSVSIGINSNEEMDKPF